MKRLFALALLCSWLALPAARAEDAPSPEALRAAQELTTMVGADTITRLSSTMTAQIWPNIERELAAKVDAATPDPTDSNNTDTVTSTVVSVADLTVKDSGPATVVAGTNATYTLTATNNGPATAKNVIVTDELPPGVTFVSGGGDGVTCALQAGSTGVVECVVGSLAPGASKTIPIVVAIDPDTPNAAVIPNNASASSTTSDPNLANNADSVTSTVNKRADLSIAKSVDSDPLVPGRNATYTLVAHNEGRVGDAARRDAVPAVSIKSAFTTISVPLSRVTEITSVLSDLRHATFMRL